MTATQMTTSHIARITEMTQKIEAIGELRASKFHALANTDKIRARGMMELEKDLAQDFDVFVTKTIKDAEEALSFILPLCQADPIWEEFSSGEWLDWINSHHDYKKQ
jgi:hypothetical protein